METFNDHLVDVWNNKLSPSQRGPYNKWAEEITRRLARRNCWFREVANGNLVTVLASLLLECQSVAAPTNTDRNRNLHR